MEQAEIDLLVSELETRMDRLRALYDQYFMGIERLEPHVPKKDVERRMAALRKEHIRNTGVRFRFQTLIQRYSTYQSYWFRICRQIEMGTYKRDVMRATARFGIDPTKERGARDEEVTATDAPAPAKPQRQVEITEAEMEDLEDGSAFLEPLGIEDDPFADIAVHPQPTAPRAPPPERFASAVRLELDDLADPFEEHDPFPKPAILAAPPSAPKIRIAPRPGASAAPVPAADPRDTERRMPAAARVVVAKRASLPDAGAPATAGGPSRQPPPPAVPPAPASSPRSLGPPVVAVPPAPASAPRLGGAAAVTSVPAPRISSPAAVPSRTPPAVRPATPATASAQPRIAPVARPAPAPAPKAPAPVPARPAATQPVGDLSGDRFGEIYSKYVATRREHNEPTHAITRDALAKQLSDSTQRLKQKHGGKPIDFEVVVKDGKTILRPVVK